LDYPPYRIIYGKWIETGEDVVVARRSYSHVEIHCHGGAAASQSILASLLAAGCEQASWQDFIKINDRHPIRAAAQIALAHCQTERTAAIVLDQYRGALEESLQQVMQYLQQGDAPTAIRQLRELLDWFDFGKHLTHPWQVVIAGPPNVGKSTLINALVGFERAIVFDQPGTTRDVVTALTAIHGWPVELADTAGLRVSADKLEATGVAYATAAIGEADLVLLVFDVTLPWTNEEQRLLSDNPDALAVHNKSDLLPHTTSHSGLFADRPVGMLLSATTGLGINQLLDAIADRLVLRTPTSGTAIPFTIEQATTIETAIALVDQGDLPQAAAELARLVGDLPRR
jgi:tRNA modification GTPase